MSHLDAVLEAVDADLDGALDRLFQFIRIPSISTEAAYADACRRAAAWLADDLASIGFEAGVRETGGHPAVVAHERAGGRPSVLFYGHYDVQPVDPVELWDADPFAPFLKTRPDGTREIRGRGAVDDKGQVMTFVEACRAFKRVTGRLPVGITLCVEGEEEAGSPNLPAFVRAHAGELKADVALVCDTAMWDPATPAITTMLRGLTGAEFTVRAAAMDLHSGFFGGAARNPNHVVARILADLHDETGRVTIPGFYDGVPELPEELDRMWRSLPFDPARFLGDVGLADPAGEEGRSLLEMIWSRPTCEVNGMWGGYTGAGFKTVIPSEASAKVSFRLVFDQDPEAIAAAFKAFVRARVPPDCSVSFTDRGTGRATAFDLSNPAFEKARRALTDEWGREAAYIGCGGSIPITHEIRDVLGMEALLVGFGLPHDRMHSPNEKYDLASFHKGIRSWVRILDALSR